MTHTDIFLTNRFPVICEVSLDCHYPFSKRRIYHHDTEG